MAVVAQQLIVSENKINKNNFLPLLQQTPPEYLPDDIRALATDLFHETNGQTLNWAAKQCILDYHFNLMASLY